MSIRLSAYAIFNFGSRVPEPQPTSETDWKSFATPIDAEIFTPTTYHNSQLPLQVSQIEMGTLGRRFLQAANETLALAPRAFEMNTTRATTSPPARRTSSFNPILAVVVSSMIVLFFVVGFASGYFKRYIVRPGDPELEDIPARRRGNRPAKPRELGLNPDVVSALPLVEFSKVQQKGKYTEDCAVCLAVFEDDDKLRVLPQCEHAFHVECIDEWFQSHSTCPLCRDSLKSLEAENSPTGDHDADGATEPGGMRRAAECDVVEVVIRGESSGAATATLSGLSQEVATPAVGPQGNAAAFIRAIRIGTLPGVKPSILRSSSVSTGLQLRPYDVDSEGTQHSVRDMALGQERAREASNAGASGSVAMGILWNFEVGAQGTRRAWSTRRSVPNLRRMEPS